MTMEKSGSLTDLFFGGGDQRRRKEEIFEFDKNEIIEFILKNIISSKSGIHKYDMDSWAGIFAQVFDDDQTFKDICTASPKLLLRSPEVVIDVLCGIIKHVSFDTSSIFKNVYADLLLNQLKSSNEAIRKSTISLYSILCQKSRDGDALLSVAEIILKGIATKSPTPEQKSYFYGVLKEIPSIPLVSTKILTGLSGLIGKESNEAAINSLLAAYHKHAGSIFESEESSKQMNGTLAFIIKGISDKSPVVRRAHILNLNSSITDSLKLDASQQQLIFKSLFEVCRKMQASGVALLDSSKKDNYSLGEAMSCLRAILWLWKLNADLDISPLFSDTLNTQDPLSFVFAERFYTKLAQSVGDELMLVNIVLLIVSNDDLYSKLGFGGENSASSAMSSIMVWLHVHSRHVCKRLLIKEISNLTRSSPEYVDRIGSIITPGLAHTLKLLQKQNTEPSMWNDIPIRSSTSLVPGLVSAMTGFIPQNIESDEAFSQSVQNALISILVFCCHPYITVSYGNDLWIRLCFRAGIPPTFITTFRQDWIQPILGGLVDLENDTTGFYKASVSSIQLVAQISPKVIIPKCIEFGVQAIKTPGAYTLTPQDVEIWRVPEGELYYDPVAAKQHDLGDGKGLGKDQKWELELKKELLAKGKSSAKMSKSDRDLYEAQVEKERAIKVVVGDCMSKVKAGVDVVESVLDACRNDATQETLKVLEGYADLLVDCLLYNLLVRENQVVQKGREKSPAAMLVGQRSVQVFEKLARIMIGPAIFIDFEALFNCLFVTMGFKTDILMKSFSKMPVDVLLKQVLLALIEGTQVQGLFTPSAFTLLFPLLHTIVHRQGRVPLLKEKVYTEAMMHVSDLLIGHGGLEGALQYLPRKAMVESLLNLIEVYPRLRVAAKGGLLALALATSHLEIEFEEGAEENDSETDDVSNLIRDVSSVLLEGLLNSEPVVRESCIGAFVHLPLVSSVHADFDVRIWICCSDPVEDVAAEALSLWSDAHGLDVLSVDLIDRVTRLVCHSSADIRIAAGSALCNALEQAPEFTSSTLSTLFDLYQQYAAEPMPEYDAYGLIIPASLNKPDQWQARSGIALCIDAIVPVVKTKDDCVTIFSFLIEKEALGDRNDIVKQQMLSAGLSLIHADSSKRYIVSLLDLLDAHLSQPSIASATHDSIRQAVVILMGTLAHHLDPKDARVGDTIEKLIDTLTTPSETVQIAVSQCLPPLIKTNKKRVDSLVKRLLEMLFTSEKYGHRRGAAYGIAGVVKGSGISALKDFLIMAHLKDAVEDKKNIIKREGALFAFETLSFTLGRVFEPYVIQLLPHLLVCYGDANRQIRDATEDACRVIMSKLSAHCVKLVLPSLLNGLQERSFRTKIGSIEVMASMSSLAPKQLGQSLPTIVPKICEALGDSHQKVQEAAREALVQFGKVIKNPEIQELVPTLIIALVNPNNKTLTALSALLDTTFVHYIDAPSLALLVPIIFRGMKERSAETKKKAAQIMGNMSSLTEPRDLVPYLDTLMPPLKEVLVDPVPDARATAARAFGTMIEKLGEDRFPGLVNELLETLQSDASGVDRSGSAQGLSEILAGLVVARLEGLLPVILNNANSIKATTREGFTTLLVYLPATFGERFTPYIAEIVPTMLEGLADESDTVREAALKVGQVIVRNYAKSAVSLLLPELEKGLFNENWRIRQNSVQLVGDLVFRIAGITQLADTSDAEAEGFGTETHRTALKTALGERYETVLASLFIVRADTSGLVRQSAVGVWKAVVANTPRTLKQILPVLMNILLASLASESQERRGVAARTLGDLVRRLGSGVLTLIIPILQEGLERGDSDTREGVCIGLCEMMSSAGKSLEEFLQECVPLIRKALVDSSADVRGAAAQAFDILHQNMGSEAIDQVIPTLLSGIKSDKGGYALEGLKEIMAIRSQVVFPVLIPTLLARPITQLNAQALGSLISVAGSALNYRLDTIIPTLVDELDSGSSKASEEISNALDTIMSTVESNGVYRIMGILREIITEGSVSKKIISLKCLTTFFTSTMEHFEEFVADMIVLSVGFFCESVPELVKESWTCYDAIVKRLKKDDMDKYVPAVKNGLRDAERALNYGEEIAAFSLPKALAPILAILLQGLIAGNSDTREASAYGLGDVINRSSEVSLKPYVTQITGPLIRVIGDRFAPPVKTAILSTLGLLLTKVPSLLKPFLPQLQRTFVKSLSESGGTAAMRSKTAQCLSAIIPLQTRLDPLVLELVQGIKTADESVELAMWDAIYGLLRGVARDDTKNISEASQNSIIVLVQEKLLQTPENARATRMGAAKCFGALALVLTEERSRELLMSLVTTGSMEEAPGVQGMLLGMERVFVDAPSTVKDTDFAEVASEKVLQYLADSKSYVVEAAIKVAAQLFNFPDLKHESILEALVSVSNPTTESTDARRESIVVLKDVAKSKHAIVAPHLKSIVPALMLSVRDRTMPIKLASERALIFLLQIPLGPDTFEKHLKVFEGASARAIGDYARRVLTKIAERNDSDTEDV